jgi:hypothetical protein
LDAKDAEEIEKNARGAASVYCSERQKGKSESEATGAALKEYPIVMETLRDYQMKKYSQYIASAEGACGPRPASAPAGACEIEINGWRPKTCAGGTNLRIWGRR